MLRETDPQSTIWELLLPRRPSGSPPNSPTSIAYLDDERCIAPWRVDTTVVEADIDYPTDADLLEHAVRKLGGLVRRVKGRGAASRTRFRDRGRAAGRRMKQLPRTLRRRRTGVAMGEVNRLTGEVAAIARHSLRRPQLVARNARQACTRRSGDGRLGRLVGDLAETIGATGRLPPQTDQRLTASG